MLPSRSALVASVVVAGSGSDAAGPDGPRGGTSGDIEPPVLDLSSSVSLGCADLCTDAQAGKCTAIKGDCSAFCKSLATVAPPASCEPKRTAYIACLNKGAVCDQSCSSEDTDLQSCIATYCAPRKTKSDCAVLIASI